MFGVMAPHEDRRLHGAVGAGLGGWGHAVPAVWT